MTKLNKRMVSVLYRLVEAKDLHPELGKVQWTDFNANEGEFEANFKELLRTLDTDPVHLRYHTGLLVKAIEWDDKGRRDDVLLRGEELTEAQQWIVKAAEKEPRPTVLQGEYVTASRTLQEASQAKESKRQRNINRWLKFGLAASLLLTSFATYKVYQAERRRLRFYETAAIATAETDPLNSLVNSLAAMNLGESWFVKFPEGFFVPLVRSRPLDIASLNSRAKIVISQDFFTLSDDLNALMRALRAFGLSLIKLLPLDESMTPYPSTSALAFSPDGQTIVSGSSYDRTLRLWDLEGKQISIPLEGHGRNSSESLSDRLGQSISWDGVTAVAFSPDGQWIVSGGTDTTLRLWSVEFIKAGGWVGDACRRLRPYLTIRSKTDVVAREARRTCERYGFWD